MAPRAQILSNPYEHGVYTLDILLILEDGSKQEYTLYVPDTNKELGELASRQTGKLFNWREYNKLKEADKNYRKKHPEVEVEERVKMLENSKRKVKELNKLLNRARLELKSSGNFVLSWYCPNPPNLEDWKLTTDEDLDEYASFIDYIDEHAETIEPEEMFQAVKGGEQQILNDLMYGSVYDEYLKMADDWSISWYKSKYPDGTTIYYHTHSGIEHVYVPEGLSDNGFYP